MTLERDITKDEMDLEKEKKILRKSVKRAYRSHGRQEITDEVLKAVIELAMASEITANLEEKLRNRKNVI